jgi:hypothetical protein
MCLVPLQVTTAKHPTAFELLDKYAETQDKIYDSFVMNFEASTDGFKSWTAILQGGKRKGGVDSEIRYDGTRFYWNRKMWANCYPDIKTFVPRNDPRSIWKLWDGNTYYWWGKEPDYKINQSAEKQCKTAKQREEYMAQRLRLTVRKDFDNSFYQGERRRDDRGRLKLDKLDFCFPDMCGDGGFYYDPELESFLRSAEELTVKNKTENIGGSQCYIIEAESKYSKHRVNDNEYKLKHCKYRIWIDPTHGYNIARLWRVWMEPGKDPSRNGTIVRHKVENVRFDKISNIWVPVEWDYLSHRKSDKNHFIKSTTHIKLTKVILDPDHDALGSFIPDVPNGWSVRFKGLEGIDEKQLYKWQDGKVVDKDGREMDVDKLIKAESEKVKVKRR